MKFSVAVETDSRLIHSPEEENTSPNTLQWDIQVLVDQQEYENIPVNGGSSMKSTTLAPIEETDSVSLPTGRSEASRLSVSQSNRKESSISISKKKSIALDVRSAPPDDILRKLSMANRGRKVSRQGEWIILQEKVGLLTSQNGVQQIKERRVKLGSSDLEKLLDLGY